MYNVVHTMDDTVLYNVHHTVRNVVDNIVYNVVHNAVHVVFNEVLNVVPNAGHKKRQEHVKEVKLTCLHSSHRTNHPDALSPVFVDNPELHCAMTAQVYQQHQLYSMCLFSNIKNRK